MKSIETLLIIHLTWQRWQHSKRTYSSKLVSVAPLHLVNFCKTTSPSSASWRSGRWNWNELRPDLSSIPVDYFIPIMRFVSVVRRCSSVSRWGTAANQGAERDPGESYCVQLHCEVQSHPESLWLATAPLRGPRIQCATCTDSGKYHHPIASTSNSWSENLWIEPQR